RRARTTRAPQSSARRASDRSQTRAASSDGRCSRARASTRPDAKRPLPRAEPYRRYFWVMRARILASIVDAQHRKWWTLGAFALGLFMIMLDNTIVNVALPTIQGSLHLKISELEWVVAGYALTFGALMLTGGKLADLFGRRLVFVVGLAVFTLSSLACGLAGSADVLIAARVVQGVGAAMMNPATL